MSGPDALYDILLGRQATEAEQDALYDAAVNKSQRGFDRLVDSIKRKDQRAAERIAKKAITKAARVSA